jgi:hypothetical protein
MTKKIRLIFIVFSLIAFSYLAISLLEIWKQERSEAESRAQRSAEIERIKTVQSEMSAVLSSCAVESLSTHFLTEFIIYEIMPIGIAWDLIEKEIQQGKNVLGPSSPASHAESLLRGPGSLLFMNPVSSKFREKRIEYLSYCKSGPSIFCPNFDIESLNPNPSMLVYELLGSKEYKEIKPEEIDIGKKKVDWPKFKTLAKRCRTEPQDFYRRLDELYVESIVATQDYIRQPPKEYGSQESDDYVLMKEEFWEIFSKTPAFQEAYSDIRLKNTKIIREIIRKNEPIAREENARKKDLEDAIFKKP